MKNSLKYVLPVLAFLFSFSVSHGEDRLVNKVLSMEKDPVVAKDLKSISRSIDNIYGHLYEKLKDGGKIVVYIDPAHGRQRSGKWQGSVTWRQSVTGKPEEFYSIKMVRALYKYLKSNNYIQVVSTEDHMQVMKGLSEDYRDISFGDTLKRARNYGAFIVLASHLNNVSPIYKSEGLSNIAGIHVTCDEYGNKFITHVTKVGRGFLTLYNRFDPTGFSERLAENLKSNLLAHSFMANDWQDGVVADDRFIYFSDFPLSAIFESGFISNPEDEALLIDRKNQDLFGKSQYDSLMTTIKEKFGVDISGSKLQRVSETSEEMIDLMTLSRFVIYYLNRKNTDKAIRICEIIDKNFSSSEFSGGARIFSDIKNRLGSYSSFLSKGKKLRDRKKYQEAAVFYGKAAHSIPGPIYSGLRKEALAVYNKLTPSKGTYSGRYQRNLGGPPEFLPVEPFVSSHSLDTPFVITVKEGQSVEDVVKAAIDPPGEIKDKICASIRGGKSRQSWFGKVFSTDSPSSSGDFGNLPGMGNSSEGIFIVKLNGDYEIDNIKKVNRVAFDPDKYQNQEYFGNSCLSKLTMSK